jgi:hypothetical protein
VSGPHAGISAPKRPCFTKIFLFEDARRGVGWKLDTG